MQVGGEWWDNNQAAAASASHGKNKREDTETEAAVACIILPSFSTYPQHLLPQKTTSIHPLLPLGQHQINYLPEIQTHNYSSLLITAADSSTGA